MVGFSGILGTGLVEDQKMIKDKLIDGKERNILEKAAEYYWKDKEAMKEKSREHYKNLSQEEKDKIK